jgi:hypothetical protein
MVEKRPTPSWGPVAGKNPGAECEWMCGSVWGASGGRYASHSLPLLTSVFDWAGICSPTLSGLPSTL